VPYVMGTLLHNSPRRICVLGESAPAPHRQLLVEFSEHIDERAVQDSHQPFWNTTSAIAANQIQFGTHFKVVIQNGHFPSGVAYSPR
jgi:hypothetical protein